ncbi:OmpP1/FadL family transporter [Roseinatronobacter alkalisoli]|uniref:Outer membrane protein transport protein n=1 Tax=Roseinatronobacter alkalisoli TaxID=3028235 RepID=A0ABT5TBZ1_9RHOB|nr:outer membrane protein transport protein [Roseinatronobacter sp. HJB301]MDD7972516.1 outer membrane protein transport protein [Roseinatronobacter sp. HJB301]
MRNYIAAGLVALGASPAVAGGIERNPQSMNILFQQGRYVEVGATYGAPRVSGNAPGATGNIARNFFTGSISYKADINEQWSYAIILDQPFGADVMYPTGTAAILTGATGKISNTSLTGILRYKFGNGFSAHAGLRSSWTSGSVNLPAFAYTMSTNTDQAWGYLVGVAYEKPEIAMRVALTYQSAIKHSFRATETGPGAFPQASTRFTTKMPESLNLEFQTGVAEDTLVFGSVRYVKWKDFDITPPQFNMATGSSLVAYQKNSMTYTLGVGRRFNENWSGSLSLSHDTGNGNPTSNLGPTGKRTSIGVGASYTLDAMTISGGIQYTKLGSATTVPPIGGQFGKNSAIGAGIRVGFRF